MAIPDNTRRLLTRRLDTHRHQRWPNLAELSIRFRGDFVYLTSTDFTGDPMPLCRLTYKKNAELWGFAIYLASHDSLRELDPPQRPTHRHPRTSPRLRLRPLPQRPHRLDLTNTHELPRRTT